MKNTRRSRGFTLVEQIFTLAVAAILVAIAVPSMARLVSRSATRTTEDALFTAAHLARNQAITHDAYTLLCPSEDGRHCSGTDHWQQGWIVAIDHNHDNQPDGAVLTHGVPDTTHVHLVGTHGRQHVRFRGDGAAPGTNLTLLVCPRQAGDGSAQTIVISNAGRIREAPADRKRASRCTVAG